MRRSVAVMLCLIAGIALAAYRAPAGSNVYQYRPLAHRQVCGEEAAHDAGMLDQIFCDSASVFAVAHYPAGWKAGPVGMGVNVDDIAKWNTNGFIPGHPPTINPDGSVDLSTVYNATYQQLLNEWNYILRYAGACKMRPEYVPWANVVGSDFGEPEMRAFVDVVKHVWDGAPVPPVVRFAQIQNFWEQTFIPHTAELEVYNFDPFAAAAMQDKLGCSVPYQRLSTPYLADLSYRSWGVKHWNTIVTFIPGYNGTTAYAQTLYALRVALSVAKDGGSDIDHVLNVQIHASNPADEVAILRAYADFYSVTSYRPTFDGPIFGYNFEQPSIKVAVKMLAWAGSSDDVFEARNSSYLYGGDYSDGVQAGRRVYASGQYACAVTSNRSVCGLPTDTNGTVEACFFPANASAAAMKECLAANTRQAVYALGNLDAVYSMFGMDILKTRYSLNYFAGFLTYEGANRGWRDVTRGAGYRMPIRMDEPGVLPGRRARADGTYAIPAGLVGSHGGWAMQDGLYTVMRGQLDPAAGFCVDDDGNLNDAVSCPYYQSIDMGARTAKTAAEYYKIASIPAETQ